MVMTARADADRRGDACVAPPSHERRSIRLLHFDYSQTGAYFVTICTRDRMCLFGDIMDGEMRLNDFGRLAHEVWERIPAHFAMVETDAWIVMPNHVHGVIFIAGPDAGGLPNAGTATGEGVAPPRLTRATHASPLQRPSGPPMRSLGAVVGSYKSAVSKRINESGRSRRTSVWQRNYYDHIIRDATSLDRIREYIAQNPARWADDPENPQQQQSDDRRDDGRPSALAETFERPSIRG